MPRRFFRKFALKRDWINDQWYLAPFSHLLQDHDLWGIRRRTVVPAFAIGLFVSFIPLPGHILMGAFAALFFRVNVPITAITTFVSNPLTVGPMYFLAYRLGFHILDLEPQPFAFELSFAWVSEGLGNIWQPLLLGCLLLGTALALAGYVSLDLLWRASIADYLARKRAKKAAK